MIKGAHLSTRNRPQGGKSGQLSVVAGMGARQMQGYQGMAGMNMQMETEDEIIKTVSVSWYKAFRLRAEGRAYRA